MTPRDEYPARRALRVTDRPIRGRILRLSRAVPSGRTEDIELLHELFEARADERREVAALEVQGRAISYSELDGFANRLARHLWERGVRRGSRVGLLLRRSAEAYGAILAVLKAGAAYVPLDPAHTTDRTMYALEDSDAVALVTTPEFSHRYDGFDGAIVDLESDRDAIDAESPVRVPRDMSRVAAGDLCYVMYRPGDSAYPRGVLIEHKSACHLARTAGAAFGVRPWDRVYQGGSLCRDASVQEMWLAFHAGATLVVPAQSGGPLGPDLAARLSRARVTVLSCATASLAALSDDVSLLRLLILRGGRCPGDLVQRWARTDRRIVNTYGHTETTVVATHAELLPGAAITAGRPLPGSRVYILDGQLRCVPWGSLGQIGVGGPGVARGYLGLPADTRARFVRDPFSPCGDGRMYLTGDLGRIDPNGNLEVLGEIERWQRESLLPEGSRS